VKKSTPNKELVGDELLHWLKGLTPQEKADLLKMTTKPRDLGRIRSRLRKTMGAGGRTPVQKDCPHCKLPMPAREFWRHEAACYAEHHPEAPRRRGRPHGGRKGDRGYAEFKQID
jgi:hypothetical protein